MQPLPNKVQSKVFLQKQLNQSQSTAAHKKTTVILKKQQLLHSRQANLNSSSQVHNSAIVDPSPMTSHSMQDARFRILSGTTSSKHASKYIREMEDSTKVKSTVEHPSIIAQKRNSRTNLVIQAQLSVGGPSSNMYNPYETINETPTNIALQAK